MIINLVSGPRNVSTALMYSFAQRSDTLASDEPFYTVYLRRSCVKHPGRADVLGAMSDDETVVRNSLMALRDKPVLFVKNMAHHIEVLHEPFMHDAIYVFLIRDPAKILLSYSEVVATPVMRYIGMAFQYKRLLRAWIRA